MPDVISYLANVGTPATFEKIAALRGFTIIKKMRNPSLCVCGGGWQYHGYVSAHDDKYVGHLGFFVPGHRIKDSMHQKLLPDEHFDGYGWQKLGESQKGPAFRLGGQNERGRFASCSRQ